MLQNTLNIKTLTQYIVGHPVSLVLQNKCMKLDNVKVRALILTKKGQISPDSPLIII